MSIELSDAVVSKLIEQSLLGAGSPAFTPSRHVGKNVFIRTVTFHYTGFLVEDNSSYLVLRDAAWIASSGRFADALATGELSEIEPFPDGEIEVHRETCTDISLWNFDLPRTQI